MVTIKSDIIKREFVKIIEYIENLEAENIGLKAENYMLRQVYNSQAVSSYNRQIPVVDIFSEKNRVRFAIEITKTNQEAAKMFGCSDRNFYRLKLKYGLQ